jgi:hypothetical protein
LKGFERRSFGRKIQASSYISLQPVSLPFSVCVAYSRRNSSNPRRLLRSLDRLARLSKHERSERRLRACGEASRFFLPRFQPGRVRASRDLPFPHPGQCTVVLISPGFQSQSEQRQLERMIDQSLRSQVVISTLDPKGLAIMMREADVSGGYPLDLTTTP